MSPTLSMIHLVPGTAVTVVVDVSGTPTTVQGTVRQLDGNLVLVDLRVPVADEAQGLRRSPRLNRRRRRPDEGRTKIKHQAEWLFAEDCTPIPPPAKPDDWLVYDKVYGVIPLEVQRRWSGGSDAGAMKSEETHALGNMQEPTTPSCKSAMIPPPRWSPDPASSTKLSPTHSSHSGVPATPSTDEPSERGNSPHPSRRNQHRSESASYDSPHPSKKQLQPTLQHSLDSPTRPQSNRRMHLLSLAPGDDSYGSPSSFLEPGGSLMHHPCQ